MALMAAFFHNLHLFGFRPLLSWPHFSTICTSSTFAHCSHGLIFHNLHFLCLSPSALVASFFHNLHFFHFRPLLSWPHLSKIYTSSTFAHCSRGLIFPHFPLLCLSPIALVASFSKRSPFFDFRLLLSWPHARMRMPTAHPRLPAPGCYSHRPTSPGVVITIAHVHAPEHARRPPPPPGRVRARMSMPAAHPRLPALGCYYHRPTSPGVVITIAHVHAP